MRALLTGAAAGGIGGAICVRLARDALEKGTRAKFITGENIFVDGGFARSSLNRMVRQL